MAHIKINNLTIQTTINKSTFLSCDKVNLEIKDKEVYGIVGSSGAGKSLLVRYITASLKKNSKILSGECYINDVLVTKHESLAVLLNKDSILKYKKEKISDLEKYLKALKEIMETNPDALVIDFPKSLRNENSDLFLNEIMKYKKKLTIIISTSELSLAKSCCNRIGYMYAGRIIKEGKASEMELNLPILEVNNLVVKFKSRGKDLTAIRNVSLSINKGECLAIVGESGSGKSVLTKTFTGMLDSNGWIDSGEIIFEGQDISKFKTDKEWQKIRGKNIAMVFQDPMTSLNPLLTIGYQISEVLRIHQGLNKKEAKKEALKLLERVGIPEPEKRYDEFPFQYSGGMRQRVVIAIALACKPKILICDEPTTALDVTIQAQILDLIKDLQKEYGFTTIYITHDLGVVANVADKVAVMYFGQIVEYGKVEEIFFDSRHPYTWALLSSLPQIATKGEELYAIEGTPPSLSSTIKGDAFAPRNPYAMKIDFVEEPPIFKVSDSHWAKTWLLDSRAPKVKKPKIIDNLSKKLEKTIYKGDDKDE